jgi:hypothetical protein
MEIFLMYNPIHKRVQISGDAAGGIKTSGNLAYMFVYTDIISYQRVGDICVPLLRTVHIDRKDGKDGDIVTVTYDKPYYVPVSKKYIENILVELKTERKH